MSAKKALGIVILITGAALLAWPSYKGAMNYAGYCFKESRYLTDEEKIELAIRRAIAAGPPAIPMSKVEIKNGKEVHSTIREIPKIYDRYDSVDQFRRLNPNCCVLTQTAPGGGGPDLGIRLLGNFSTYVRMEYAFFYTDAMNQERVFDRVTYPKITNCGKVW